MRSVRQARKPRASTRRADARRGSRPVRTHADRGAFGRRKRNDSISLFFERVRHWLAFGRPMLWLTGLLAAAVLIAGIFSAGYVRHSFAAGENVVDTVISDAGFGIASVQLSGNRRTQPDDILAALGFQPGESIFAADLHAARKRLLALPWVYDADVQRQYPNSISVDVVERLPFALWQTSDLLYVVERSGRTITVARPAQFPHLPLLVGDGAPQSAPEFVDAVSAHRAVSARMKAMQRVSQRRWNLILDGNVTVELPEDGWQKQLDLLEQLIVDKGVLERDISEIDLREKDNYFFVLRNGQKQQATRGNAA